MAENRARKTSKSVRIAAVVALLLGGGLLAGWLAVQGGDGVSEIKSDERVVFFPTAARLSDDGKSWIVPIHGWIFEAEHDDWLRGAALKQFRKALGLDPQQASTKTFEKRARLFLVDNERGKRVAVRIGEETRTLGPSGRDGHFTGTVTLSAETVRRLSNDGRLTYQAVTRPRDRREFRGVVHLIEPEGLSVISDIDDTVKVTEVTDKKKLVENTFFQPFRAVEGMPDLYRRWAEAGARFHFVSSSPWQLYGHLSPFLHEAGFPEATFHLKGVRFKDSSFLKLFADPLKTKPAVIEPILKAYPKRQFILVGDSGEKDPEVYGLLARRYPDQVQRIYIRKVTNEGPDSPRYREAFHDVPTEKWQLFTDPKTLTLPQKGNG